ncbi:MAG TPA: hypothetical protein VGP68_22895 [Gemmataceae bacterium]|nr:hypothetical protein [Gemmataceae bacterium]
MRCGRMILTQLLLASLVGLTTGCPSVKPKKPSVITAPRRERGPHGAPLAYWADDYHLEVCIDRAAQEVSVYVLKSTGSQPAPIEISSLTLQLTSVDPPLEIPLQPAPREEDPKGSASCFRATNAAFAAEGAFYGMISGKVGEQSYDGEFDERARSPIPVHKPKKK